MVVLKGEIMKMNCLVIEDNVLEIINELQQQLESGVVCCRCGNKCESQTTCALSMKNLLTDIKIFKEAYQKQNEEEIPKV